MIRYIDEFRNSDSAKKIAEKINLLDPGKTVSIMEVCGGHTHTIHKFGIKDLLPPWIDLKSGPGCPVCVTAQSYIDMSIALAGRDDTIVATFGDMIRVPGTESSLLTERSKGSKVKICLSPEDALTTAVENPDKKIVFLGIGFETTAPSIALSILSAFERNIRNYFVLCGLKTMPRALITLLDSKDVSIDAFICPGHVSAITGLSMYELLARHYKTPCVVSGFEPLDLLLTIGMIIRQITMNVSLVENEYTRVVKYDGNAYAQSALKEVFIEQDSVWRGLGTIPGSGLAIVNKYERFDAAKAFDINVPAAHETPGCICGKVMSGKNSPDDCSLFGRSCTPDNPLGACMVSSEGTCGIHYLYRKT